MALIKCPECGKEVSDKASACIHCGYPLNPKDEKKQYDLLLVHHGSNKIKCIKLVEKYLKLDVTKAKKICDSTEHNNNPLIYSSANSWEIDEIKNQFSSIGAIVKVVESNSSESVTNNSSYTDNILRCPKCGSTSITTGQRGFKLTTGFLGSSKTVNRCANCGHTWEPR